MISIDRIHRDPDDHPRRADGVREVILEAHDDREEDGPFFHQLSAHHIAEEGRQGGSLSRCLRRSAIFDAGECRGRYGAVQAKPWAPWSMPISASARARLRPVSASTSMPSEWPREMTAPTTPSW